MEQEQRRPSLGDAWKAILMIIGIIAIIQELRKPKEERTWHGKVGDFVPYEFRVPTMDRVKDTYWNPDGPLLGSKVFGVGWAPNFGAATRFCSRSDTTVVAGAE